MPKSRDLIYINAYPDENRVVTYGIEFKEFMIALEKPIDNILVLAGYFYEGEINYTTGCEFVRKENIPSIINTDVYRFGDFCWVDFENLKALDFLEPWEVAELLYLGHMKKPVTSPFFDKLNNRFSYLAHDDGWFNMFYCRNLSEFEHVISKVISSKVKSKFRRKIVPEVSLDTCKQLIEYAKDGLLIDFDSIIGGGGRSLWIPIIKIGKMMDMDEMYNDLQRHVDIAKFEGRLVLRKDGWSIKVWE